MWSDSDLKFECIRFFEASKLYNFGNQISCSDWKQMRELTNQN